MAQPYKIQRYSYEQAKKLGVEIKPSTVKGKKIDVYRRGEKIASIGAVGYKDFPTYLNEDKKIAEERRKAYKARHQKDRTKVGTPGFFADRILW